MGSLDALSRLETVVYRLGLEISRHKVSRHITIQTISRINQANFDLEEHQEIYAHKEYSLLRSIFFRLFILQQITALIERVFSQGGIIMRPHPAKMSDEILEM